MKQEINVSDFCYRGDRGFAIAKVSRNLKPLYENKKEYKKQLSDFRNELDELQNMMYAHDRYSMLLIFQAMDAAGKDGTIRHVMSGINPHGVHISSFKKPNSLELDHNFMWRTTQKMPERGKIGIFNRSYYEEVLVVKVHPEILTKYQRVPSEYSSDIDTVWQERYEDIRNFEKYAARNGTRVLKFFLNLSKEEQGRRFISRIDEPEKNWKFSEADVKERGFWDDYMNAYQDAINATASPEAPWFVIPADDKKNMRLIVSQIILEEMKKMNLHYPVVSDERRLELQEIRASIKV